MKRTRLQFESIHQIMGSDELAVILLTDEERRHALTVVCDHPMTQQLMMRMQNPDVCRKMLPEALYVLVKVTSSPVRSADAVSAPSLLTDTVTVMVYVL